MGHPNKFATWHIAVSTGVFGLFYDVECCRFIQKSHIYGTSTMLQLAPFLKREQMTFCVRKKLFYKIPHSAIITMFGERSFHPFYSISSHFMITKRSSLFATAVFFILSPLAARAITIVPTYVDGAGQTWTAERRGVIQQAISDWQTALPDSHTINVTFDFTNAGTGGYLGQWYVSSQPMYAGTDIYPWTPELTHTIHFNADLFSTSPNYTWWDPSPTTSNDQPFAAWDALSVARHEICHMVGFTNGFYVDNFYTPQQIDKWGSHIAGSVFDPGGLNVSMASSTNLAHVLNSGATAGDLMVPALVNGQRRGISATDLNMLQLAYGYTIVPPKTPTTYTLAATAGKTLMHKGDSSGITATITNTGTGTADSLDFAGLSAYASSGTIGGASTSGGPLAISGGTASNTGLTFTSPIAGTISITPTATATNHTLGTAATLSTATPATVTVYSGLGVWNTTGSGSWTDFSKWTALGGVPGIDGELSAADTATFSKTFSSPAAVSLNGATPRLAGLTLQTFGSGFTIAPGSGGSLTLQAAAEALVSVTNGNNGISAPVVLGSDARITGAGSLNFSGGISGAHVLTVANNIAASSIHVDSLRIGTSFASAAAVPEPGTFALLGMGVVGLLVFRRRRKA